MINPTIATETPKNDSKVKEINTSQLDSGLLELAKNCDTKAIAELIKNSLQQTDIKVRATLNKGLLQVVIVSNQVPKQDYSVEAIPKLVQDWESTLIDKLKVVGMQEIDGSNNSKMIWTQDYELKSNYFNQSEISNNRNTLIKLANNGDMSAISKLCYLELCYLEFTQDDLNISSPKIDITTRIDNDNVLRINIRCYEKLDQNIVVNSIYKGIVDLDFNNIINIMISMYVSSNMNPTWVRKFTSIQSLQKFCDSRNNNQQPDFPISSNDDFNSSSQKSNYQTEDPAIKSPENGESISIYASSNESIPFRTTSYSNMNSSFIGNRKVVISLVISAISIILVFGLLFPAFSKKKLIDSQVAKQVLTELQKINSRLDIGLNLIEYRKEVADLKFTVETFNNDESSKINPTYLISIKKSLQAHIDAVKMWENCDKFYCEIKQGVINSNTNLAIEEVLLRYPFLTNKFLEDTSNRIYKDTVLQHLWSNAKASEDSASIELNR